LIRRALLAPAALAAVAVRLTDSRATLGRERVRADRALDSLTVRPAMRPDWVVR
jgi:hypothetical protein